MGKKVQAPQFEINKPAGSSRVEFIFSFDMNGDQEVIAAAIESLFSEQGQEKMSQLVDIATASIEALN